jgi:two-component system invasion response regulator UvrY
MSEHRFDNQIALLQHHIVALQQRVKDEPAQAAQVLVEALEDLRAALEELRVADEALHQQNEELASARLAVEAERQRYQELFDFAPDGYLVTNVAGSIQEANRAAAAMLGVLQHHLVGKPLMVFLALEEHEAFCAQLLRLQQSEGVQELEMRVQPRQGAPFLAALTVAPICDAQGTVVGLRWLLHDITMRKQAQQALQQEQQMLEHRVAERTAELQQLNTQLHTEIAEHRRTAKKAHQAQQDLHSSREQLRQLAAYLQNAQEHERTHIARELHDELAQPLTSLKMDLIWLARRAVTAPTAWHEHLTTMATVIDTLGESVHRIGTKLRPNVLDNLGLEAAMEWQLKEVCERAGLTYTLQMPAKEVTLGLARTTAVFRIFQEALTNAIRHAEASNVTVRLSQHADVWLLTIIDDGKGITSDELTNYASLGLLGMRERAHLWGGDVSIQGTPSLGTTVTIQIPRDLVATEVTSGMIRVLIADDHATVRAGVKRFLADTADLVVAREAGTAQEILEAVAAKACDVVLLDISLPGRDGLDVLKQLKQLYPSLPILMFSVHAEDQYAVRALKTGAAGYLTKNSAPEVLITALRKVAQGGRYISPALAERLAMEVTGDADKPLHTTLANREYQVLLMLAGGQTIKEIASHLSLSVKTVSTYRTRILQKLRLKTTADIIRYALSQQLVSDQPAIPSSLSTAL